MQPVGVAGAWTTVLDSEFTGSSLPFPWRSGFPPSTGPTTDVSPDAMCIDPSHAVMTGTELDLNLTTQVESCGGGPYEGPPQTSTYVSGAVSTSGQYTYTYGVAEARIWLPAAPDGSVADWPSFWSTNSPWPQDGEIDVIEGLAVNGRGVPCFHFHYGTSPSTEQSWGGCGSSSTGWTAGWHTFADDWEPGAITFYYDGVKVGQTTTGVTSQPQYLILGLGYGGGGAGELVTPASQRTAYVRVWQHPAGSTVGLLPPSKHRRHP